MSTPDTTPTKENSSSPFRYREVGVADWKKLHGIENSETETALALRMTTLLTQFDKATKSGDETSNFDYLKEQDPRISNKLEVDEIISFPPNWGYFNIAQEASHQVTNVDSAKNTFFMVTEIAYHTYKLSAMNGNKTIEIPRYLVEESNPQKPINWRAIVASGGEVTPNDVLPTKVEP